jgi:hypothetical protein
VVARRRGTVFRTNTLEDSYKLCDYLTDSGRC